MCQEVPSGADRREQIPGKHSSAFVSLKHKYVRSQKFTCMRLFIDVFLKCNEKVISVCFIINQ